MLKITIMKEMKKFSPEPRGPEVAVSNSNFQVFSCKFPLADRLSSPRSSLFTPVTSCK